MSKSNKIILIIGIILIGLGWFKPDLSWTVNSSISNNVNYVVDAPSNNDLVNSATKITEIVRKSNDSTRKSDCLRLSSLYADMAILIAIDEEDTVIKDTSSLRMANSLCGKMLGIDVKDKYPNLAEAAKELVVLAIGDDDVTLTPELRTNAVDAFRALSWAFYEGSK